MISKTIETISCQFKNEVALYCAFMPFLKSGGLFIRTSRSFALKDSVLLQIQLPNEPEKNEISGQVVWITPQGAQSAKPQGIGVEFSGNDAKHLTNKIEMLLAGMLKSTQITDTM